MTEPRIVGAHVEDEALLESTCPRYDSLQDLTRLPSKSTQDGKQTRKSVACRESGVYIPKHSLL